MHNTCGCIFIPGFLGKERTATICIAIAQPAKTNTLTIKQLERGWNRNPDGGGFAFINDEGMIEQFHTMDKETLILTYLEKHEQYGESSPFIVHMRIATHGGIKLSVTHPYTLPLKGEGEMVFAHNGIFLGMNEHTSDDVSDTMVFGEHILSQLDDSWLDNKYIFDMVETYCAYSKLVFLTTSPALQSELYIVNDKDGTWHEGVWYSNHSCLAWGGFAKPMKGYSSKGYKRFGTNTSDALKKGGHKTPAKDYEAMAKKFMDKKEAEEAGECHAMGDEDCTCIVCVRKNIRSTTPRMVFDEKLDQWVAANDYVVEDTFGDWLYEVNVRYEAEELVGASVEERQEMISHSAEKGDACIICTGIDQCYCNDLCNECYCVYFDCECEGSFISIYRAIGESDYTTDTESEDEDARGSGW